MSLSNRASAAAQAGSHDTAPAYRVLQKSTPTRPLSPRRLAALLIFALGAFAVPASHAQTAQEVASDWRPDTHRHHPRRQFSPAGSSPATPATPPRPTSPTTTPSYKIKPTHQSVATRRLPPSTPSSAPSSPPLRWMPATTPPPLAPVCRSTGWAATNSPTTTPGFMTALGILLPEDPKMAAFLEAPESGPAQTTMEQKVFLVLLAGRPGMTRFGSGFIMKQAV